MMPDVDLDLPERLDGDVWLHEARAFGVLSAAHTHRELEFNLVISGQGGYVIDEQRYELSQGTLLWLYPKQQHVLVDRSDDFSMWIAVFRPRLIRRTCRHQSSAALRGGWPAGVFCKQLLIDRAEQLALFFSSLASWQNQPDRFNAGLAHALMETWWAFESAEDFTETSEVHPAVQRAARLLRDDDEMMPMDMVAMQSGLSESHLSRLFKQQTGVSMVRFRHRCMVERFLRLYGHGRRMNMTEAALAAGFGSYVQFHRVFTQVIGRGPVAHLRRRNV